MTEHEALAWGVVEAVKLRCMSARRQQTDEDWVEEITAALESVASREIEEC